MFDHTLNFETGWERVGEPIELFQVEIPPDSDVLLALKEYRQVLDMLFSERAVTNGIRDPSQIELRNPRFQIEYDSLFRGFFGVPVAVLRSILMSRRFSVSPGVGGIVLCEALMNAAEHGVHFGKKGGIHISCLTGTQGEFWVFTQPNPGPGLEEGSERYKNYEDPFPLRYKAQTGEIRGGGHSWYADASVNDSQVWYTHLETGYAILIFGEGKSLDDAADPPEPGISMPSLEGNVKLLWDSLVHCAAGTTDPRKFYERLFEARGTTLEGVLAEAPKQVCDLFDINVRGFLDEDI